MTFAGKCPVYVLQTFSRIPAWFTFAWRHWKRKRERVNNQVITKTYQEWTKLLYSVDNKTVHFKARYIFGCSTLELTPLCFGYKDLSDSINNRHLFDCNRFLCSRVDKSILDNFRPIVHLHCGKHLPLAMSELN